MTVHKQELAIQNYKKSLELNPKNTNATEMLKRLELPTPAKAETFPLLTVYPQFDLTCVSQTTKASIAASVIR